MACYCYYLFNTYYQLHTAYPLLTAYLLPTTCLPTAYLLPTTCLPTDYYLPHLNCRWQITTCCLLLSKHGWLSISHCSLHTLRCAAILTASCLNMTNLELLPGTAPCLNMTNLELLPGTAPCRNMTNLELLHEIERISIGETRQSGTPRLPS